MIERVEITEGNLKAVKDTSTFGGPNMWRLYVQRRNGYWKEVQWMVVWSIQELFETELPRYKQVAESKFEKE